MCFCFFSLDFQKGVGGEAKKIIAASNIYSRWDCYICSLNKVSLLGRFSFKTLGICWRKSFRKSSWQLGFGINYFVNHFLGFSFWTQLIMWSKKQFWAGWWNRNPRALYITLKILQTVNFLENVSKNCVAMQLNIDKQFVTIAVTAFLDTLKLDKYF